MAYFGIGAGSYVDGFALGDRGEGGVGRDGEGEALRVLILAIIRTLQGLG